MSEYIPTGSFANNSIAAFKPYCKDGSLNVEAVKKDWALNDAQIPMLTAELEAAGLLSKAEVKATAPLVTKTEKPEKKETAPPV